MYKGEKIEPLSDNLFGKADLIKLTSEPLGRQYNRIISKIMEAINWTNGDILICFSGGKDSALILDMYCEIISKFYPHLMKQPIKVAWANTTMRFVRLQETEPAKVTFAFKPYDEGGLGYKETCEFLNEYCGTKIAIPDTR